MDVPIAGTYGLLEGDKRLKVDSSLRINIPEEMIGILKLRQAKKEISELVVYYSSRSYEGCHYLLLTDSKPIVDSDPANYYFAGLDDKGRTRTSNIIKQLVTKSKLDKQDGIIIIGNVNHLIIINSQYADQLEEIVQDLSHIAKFKQPYNTLQEQSYQHCQHP